MKTQTNMKIQTKDTTILIGDDSDIAKRIKDGDEYDVVDGKIKFNGKNFNIKKIVKDFEKRIQKLEDK